MTEPRDLKPGDRFKVNPSVRTRALDDELILLDLNQGEYFSLNGTGREVWAALEQGSDLATVEQLVSARWPIQREDAGPMITGLVRDLLDRGLIAREP